MSATSGIGVSENLVSQFSSALSDKSIRFIKISIQNESLVHDTSIDASGTLEQDLPKLQTILHESTPSYILARTDEPSGEWVAIYYVPDTAKVRDKMLYASTRASLTKSLGSAHFPTSLYANSLSDLTPSSYASHLAHLAAPKPLSLREQEMAVIKEAERDTGNGGGYAGSGTRINHIDSGVGLAWSAEVEDAVKDLEEGDGGRLVLINIDTATETLLLTSATDSTVEELASNLPASEPSYAFFAWPNSHASPAQRTIVFLYSCPSTSPIKHRMLYSCGSAGVFLHAKSLLNSSSSVLAKKKIETSDPKEVDEAYLIAELDIETGGGGGRSGARQMVGEWEQRDKPFAKPKGPARRR